MIITATKTEITAKEIKAQMIAEGIKVLKCRQDRSGVNIAIDGTEDNKDKFIAFCSVNGLMRSPLQRKLFSVASIKGEFFDFGTLFKFSLK